MSVRITSRTNVSPRRPRTRAVGGRHAVALCAAMVALPAAASAATMTWDGDTDGVWATPENWVGDVAPAVGGTDTVKFVNAGNAHTVIDLGGTTYAANEQTINFETDQVAAYTIGAGGAGAQTLVIGRQSPSGNNARGGSIAVAAGVTNNQVFDANVKFGNSGGSWTMNLTNNSPTATLTFNGGFTFGGSGKGLAFRGPGDIIVNGFIGSSNSPTITKNDAGTTFLAHAANTFTSVVRINDGVLKINSMANYSQASSLGAQTSTDGETKLQISGGTLQFVGTESGSTNRLFSLGAGTDGASSVIDASGSAPLQFTATGPVAFVTTTSASTSGTTADASTTIKVADASRLAVGMSVTGSSRLAENTIITAIDGNDITISNPTSGGTISSGTSLTFGGGPRGLTLGGTSTSDNTFAPVLSDIGSINGSDPAASVTSLTKAGPGTWTLLGANTYTGPTTITGGTLRLGASDVIADASNLNLAGGTLAAGGVTETVGTLTLSLSSNIDLDGGDSILSFADSSLVEWADGALLNILNWDGDLGGNGNDQVFVGVSSSGLGALQVQAVRFINPAGLPAGNYNATLLPTGELVAVPEPAAAALLALLLPAGLRRRRTC